MLLTTILRRIWRFYVAKSGSDLKIRYMRRQGMKIGMNCHFETLSFGTEPYLIEVGDDVSIANGSVFITHDAGIKCFLGEFPAEDIFGKIVIGNNVFVGINCTLLLNTTIGNNCIVGAGSVVRGKFPDNCVIMGNPAKVVSSINLLKLLYTQSPGRLSTAFMTDAKKKPIVIEHFKNLK